MRLRLPQCLKLTMRQALFVSCAGQSVRHHMLTNYFHAILSVVLAQFTGLGFIDGMDGVVRLAEASPYIRVSRPAAFLHVKRLSVCLLACLPAFPGWH